jgi:hypothetical protein
VSIYSTLIFRLKTSDLAVPRNCSALHILRQQARHRNPSVDCCSRRSRFHFLPLYDLEYCATSGSKIRIVHSELGRSIVPPQRELSAKQRVPRRRKSSPPLLAAERLDAGESWHHRLAGPLLKNDFDFFLENFSNRDTIRRPGSSSRRSFAQGPRGFGVPKFLVGSAMTLAACPNFRNSDILRRRSRI